MQNEQTSQTQPEQKFESSKQARRHNVECAFSALHKVVRTHVSTCEAAFYLNRRTQTLRVWASKENGPLRPIRVQGRLAWPTADLRDLLGVRFDPEQGK
jgi:hypothetical protein